MSKPKKTNVIHVNDIKNSIVRKKMLKWFEGRGNVTPSPKPSKLQREV